MPRVEPFRQHTDRYEAWFETFEAAYESEIAALRAVGPDPERGLEIGVGTGRFAGPLGYQYGVDPAPEMLTQAVDRGVIPVMGVAEALPFRDGRFDSVLLVTTVCFVDDLHRTFEEAARVLRPGGWLVIGYIDRGSRVGRHYQDSKDENPFYRDATFVSTEEVLEVLARTGFEDVEVRQTIFSMPDEMEEPDPVREGYGDGSFVALAARHGDRL